MGTLTFQVIDAIDGTLSKSYANFSDAAITKWIEAYQSAANVQINGTATRAQVFDYIISQVVSGWVSDMQAYDSAQAVAAATAAASAAASAISIS